MFSKVWSCEIIISRKLGEIYLLLSLVIRYYRLFGPVYPLSFRCSRTPFSLRHDLVITTERVISDKVNLIGTASKWSRFSLETLIAMHAIGIKLSKGT